MDNQATKLAWAINDTPHIPVKASLVCAPLIGHIKITEEYGRRNRIISLREGIARLKYYEANLAYVARGQNNVAHS